MIINISNVYEIINIITVRMFSIFCELIFIVKQSLYDISYRIQLHIAPNLYGSLFKAYFIIVKCHVLCVRKFYENMFICILTVHPS